MANANAVEVEGGLEEVETQELTWTIPDMANMMRDEALFNSQHFEFQAGSTLGLTSRWRISIGAKWIVGGSKKTRSGLNSPIRFDCRLLQRPASFSGECLMADIAFGIEGVNGEMLICYRGQGPLNMLRRLKVIPDLIRRLRDVPNFLVNGSLLVRIIFKIFSAPSPPAVLLAESGHVPGIRFFNWKINNFFAVMQEKSLVDSQYIDFLVLDTHGIPSKWRISLAWGHYQIGVYFKLLEKSDPGPGQEFIFAKCTFSIGGGDGEGDQIYEKKLGPYNMAATEAGNGIGYPKFLPKWNYGKDCCWMLVDGTLILRVNFQVYPSPAPGTML